MQYALAYTPVSPMRATPSHRSEMVSQLLFGEKVVVWEAENDFAKVKSTVDGYEGWVQAAQLKYVDFNTRNTIGYLTENGTALLSGKPIHLSIGTPIYANQGDDCLFDLNGLAYEHNVSLNQDNIRRITSLYFNTAYLWGGRSAFGIDCSGFTQQVFKFFAKELPRDAYQQAELGTSIGFLEETKMGDLAFFDDAEGRIVHVGILLDTNTIIHASGNVRIDKIDAQGIVHSGSGIRTHQLRILKRIV